MNSPEKVDVHKSRCGHCQTYTGIEYAIYGVKDEIHNDYWYYHQLEYCCQCGLSTAYWYPRFDIHDFIHMEISKRWPRWKVWVRIDLAEYTDISNRQTGFPINYVDNDQKEGLAELDGVNWIFV